jgi:hypothetical protein
MSSQKNVKTGKDVNEPTAPVELADRHAPASRFLVPHSVDYVQHPEQAHGHEQEIEAYPRNPLLACAERAQVNPLTDTILQGPAWKAPQKESQQLPLFLTGGPRQRQVGIHSKSRTRYSCPEPMFCSDVKASAAL